MVRVTVCLWLAVMVFQFVLQTNAEGTSVPQWGALGGIFTGSRGMVPQHSTAKTYGRIKKVYEHRFVPATVRMRDDYRISDLFGEEMKCRIYLRRKLEKVMEGQI